MDIKLLLQIAGVLLGLLYLWLEYRADIRLWIVGLVMPLIHGALYYKSGLYADCSMQAYYVLAGLYGWLVWRRRGRKTDAGLTGPEDAEGAKRAAALRIGHTPLRTVPALAGVYAAAHIGPAADPLHGQHRTLLGRGDHGAVGRGDVDAVAQAGGAMARVAGRGSGDRRALPL